MFKVFLTYKPEFFETHKYFFTHKLEILGPQIFSTHTQGANMFYLIS